MNDELRGRIEGMRAALDADPDGIVIGDIRAGNPDPQSVPTLEQHRELLAVMDGGRCGEIDFWSGKELAGNQFTLSTFPGGEDAWLCIGQVLYKPLLIQRETGQVYFVRDPYDFDPGPALGTLDEFLTQNVFGPGYARSGTDDTDDWYQLLRTQGYA